MFINRPIFHLNLQMQSVRRFVFSCVLSSNKKATRPILFYSQSVIRLREFSTNCKLNALKMSKSALVLLVPGAEEMEFVIIVDVLRRAGITTTVASLDDAPAKCSRGVVIVPDTLLDKVKEQSFDAIVLPGGLGCADTLATSALVGSVLQAQEKSGRIVAAICAAPVALLAHSIGLGKKITSYPAMKDKLVDKYEYVDGPNVVQDGQLLTSRGPGTAFIFALTLSEILAGKEKAAEVSKGMLLNTEYKL